MRTTEQDAQYQKERRAKMAALKVPVEIIELGQSVAGGEVRFRKVVLDERVREYKGSTGYHYLPGDEVIGNMTQKQRDTILSKMPMTKARTR